MAAQDNGPDLSQAKELKPVGFTGNLWAQSGFYDVSGIPARSNNFIWSLGGNASLNLYESVSLPFSFTVGQYGNSVHRPTFGQFGISPRYKSLTVHLGHRNLNFSPYTLAGHTFLGAAVELRPGLFRFAAMSGRLRKAQETQPNLISIPPTFRRTAFGGKIGIGTQDHFIDLIVLKGKDDPASLPNPEQAQITPAENLVLGVSSKLQLAKQLGFYLDFAVSAFTRDQNSKLYEGSRLSLDNFIPSGIFTSRYSSRANLAGKTGLRYTGTNFQMGLEYERIDPEYETMGSFFFLNDVQNILLTPAIRLGGGMVNLNGSLGFQRNNLLNNRSETSHRFIGNGTLSYSNPGKPFGFALNYTNFTITQADGRFELSDTIRLSMVTTNVNLSPYWNWVSASATKSLVFSANYQELNDRNTFTREFTDMTTLFFNGTYSLFLLEPGWGVNAGGNYNQVNVFNLDTERYGVSTGLNKQFFANKLNLALNGTYNLTRINNERDGSTWSLNLTSGLSASQKLHFSLYTNVLKNNSAQFDDYLEWMGGAQLNLVLR